MIPLDINSEDILVQVNSINYRKIDVCVRIWSYFSKCRKTVLFSDLWLDQGHHSHTSMNDLSLIMIIVILVS